MLKSFLIIFLFFIVKGPKNFISCNLVCADLKKVKDNFSRLKLNMLKIMKNYIKRCKYFMFRVNFSLSRKKITFKHMLSFCF